MLNPAFLKRLRNMAEVAESESDRVHLDPNELLMLLDEIDENAEEIQQLAEDLLAFDAEEDYLN